MAENFGKNMQKGLAFSVCLSYDIEALALNVLEC